MTTAFLNVKCFLVFYLQWDLFKKMMREYIGLLKIPCFRTKTDDPKFIFTTLSSLSTPPLSLVNIVDIFLECMKNLTFYQHSCN